MQCETRLQLRLVSQFGSPLSWSPKGTAGCVGQSTNATVDRIGPGIGLPPCPTRQKRVCTVVLLTALLDRIGVLECCDGSKLWRGQVPNKRPGPACVNIQSTHSIGVDELLMRVRSLCTVQIPISGPLAFWSVFPTFRAVPLSFASRFEHRISAPHVSHSNRGISRT